MPRNQVEFHRVPEGFSLLINSGSFESMYRVGWLCFCRVDDVEHEFPCGHLPLF